MEDRREKDTSAVMADWLKYLLGIALAALLGYEATVNTVNARIAIMETKQQGVEQRLDRIESKVDRLLQRP